MREVAWIRLGGVCGLLVAMLQIAGNVLHGPCRIVWLGWISALVLRDAESLASRTPLVPEVQ